MNIIIEKQKDTKIIDGINEILSLDDETFKKVIEQLESKSKSLESIRFYYTTDGCENPSGPIQLGLEKIRDDNGEYISRAYYSSKQFSISEIFKCVDDKSKELKKDSKEFNRVKRLLKTRDLDFLKTRFVDEKVQNKELIDKVFEIVSDDEICNRFLDYNNNKDCFSIKGQSVDIGEYLTYLGKIFGNRDKNGNFNNINLISNSFYIPELYQYQRRYSQIFDTINIDRYVNPTYEFKKFTTLEHISDTIIRKGEEPEWNINEELNNAVLQGMSEELSLEEKAMYIYCKLCEELSYDEGYFFKGQLEDGRYDSTFSKQHLEGIKPKSKVTCWDFSRIFSKMVNELDGDIEAVIISKGVNCGHYLVGFYTDRVSVMLEAINGRTFGTNDLMKAKNGIKFEGLEIISDREGIIEKAVDKVHLQIFGKQQISIVDYLQELEALPKEEVPNDLGVKLQSFTEVMKKNNISGNEATQTFVAFHRAGFFGEELDRAYLGKREIHNGMKKFRRMTLIRSKKEFEEKVEDSCLYLMDLDCLEISACTAQDVKKKLKSGEYVYESKKHKMTGIDMEENNDVNTRN